MAKTAGVYILDIPYHADKAYTYNVPATERESVEPGSVVLVPFGRGNRRVTGIVAEVAEGKTDLTLKPIIRTIGDRPVLTDELLRLCMFVKEHTLCTFGDALRAVVPSSVMSKVIINYRIIPAEEYTGGSSFEAAIKKLGDKGRRVYEMAVKKGRFSRQAIQAELDFDCSRALLQMIELGLCERTEELKEASRGLKKRILSLSHSLTSGGQADSALVDEALVRLRSDNQKRILRYVADYGESPDTAVFDTLGISTQTGRTSVATLEKKGLLKITLEDEFRNHFTVESLLKEGGFEGMATKPKLTDEQEAARRKIAELYDSGKPSAALLHGVTGSGKTNVIMASIDRVLQGGRGVIMLVPEIALTPQTVGIFVRRYGDRIAVLHSGLSAGERFDAWRRIRDGIATVVIGTRSAVFAPMRNIGMIIIDEEHEYTYKSDTNPKYLAHDIARYRCSEHNAVMVLSSATPSLSSYYKAREGKYTLIELNNRFGNRELPTVQIYDMRGETATGNLSPVGSLLRERLENDKEEGNQSILFLNRRGYNNYVSCRSCGKSIKCPHCSVTLTYHSTSSHMAQKTDDGYEESRRKNGYLACHMCGYRTKVPDSCPECGKNHFLFMGYGTQKAEDDIISMFPDLKVLRMDHDTTSTKFSHEDILGKFRRGEADVLLGTQMVTKGHDFPRVATVGVLNADGALFADDYRAGERTFAMLTQVIGRAGRGDVPGVAVVQTYNPDHEVLHLAAKQDYKRFYEGEIKLRKALTFPPFCDIAVITLSSTDEGYLGLVTARMHERIIEHTRLEFSDIPMILYGPFEAPVYKVQNTCRMRLVMKCKLNKRTREFISELMCEFGKSSPTDHGKKTVRTKSNSRINISVDLNPSTV